MNPHSFSRTDYKLIHVLRYTAWALCTKAVAHCRSWHCFQAGQKWNTLVLFIMHCSIMNVWKVECAAVIYFQGIRGETAVLRKSVGLAVISWALRESQFFSLIKIICISIQCKKNNPNHHCPYWFNSTHYIFLKYLLGCVANKPCKSWCIRAHPTLCVISFWRLKIWLNNHARTFIIPVSVLLQAQLIMVNQPKPPGFPDLIIHHAFV